eukprot:15168833-Alexandrium_andersonii.AAC.1
MFASSRIGLGAPESSGRVHLLFLLCLKAGRPIDRTAWPLRCMPAAVPSRLQHGESEWLADFAAKPRV